MRSRIRSTLIGPWFSFPVLAQSTCRHYLKSWRLSGQFEPQLESTIRDATTSSVPIFAAGILEHFSFTCGPCGDVRGGASLREPPLDFAGSGLLQKEKRCSRRFCAGALRAVRGRARRLSPSPCPARVLPAAVILYIRRAVRCVAAHDFSRPARSSPCSSG